MSNRGSRVLRTVVVMGLVGAAWAAFAVAAQARDDGQHRIVKASKAPNGDGTVGPAARRAMRQGYLVPDQDAYEAAKARAARRAGGPVRAAPEDPLAPATVRKWQGIRDPGRAPSDSTSAVGRTRFIELVNSRFAIYNKTSNVPLATGTAHSLAGVPNSHNVFDPQIMWDAQTNRFFYVWDDIVSNSDNRLVFGFSKTASPNSAADWCKYAVLYGADFPDYPKLGDSRDFILIGANVFTGVNFTGSDLVAIGKPPAGTTCPAASSFEFGIEESLKAQNGQQVFTPVPANQIDTSGTGYVEARSISLPATFLSQHRVTRNATTGAPVIQNPGQNVVVPSYTFPPNAPQPATSNTIDTLDARPTQAVMAIDPDRGASGLHALWIQHAVAGGAGSRVRWYEINPATRTLFQSGTVLSGSHYNFNGAISPDRIKVGSTTSFGQNMVLGYNVSSSTLFPRIMMVSKQGTAAQSAPVGVKSSANQYDDFSCITGTCRWGDYAGASPDPTPPLGSSRVWLTSQYAGPISTTGAAWRTFNWVATP